jgi:hypothetical protein
VDVKKSDWKLMPIPVEKVDLGYQKVFRAVDAQKIMSGYKPEDMDDRWFIYCEDSWVYFVRSWTGYHIFGFKLAVSPDGSARVVASWANRNPEEYQSKSKGNDIQTINDLINGIFGVERDA